MRYTIRNTVLPVALTGLAVLVLSGCGTPTAVAGDAPVTETTTVTKTAPPTTVIETQSDTALALCLLDSLEQMEAAYQKMNDSAMEMATAASSILHNDLNTGNMVLEGAQVTLDEARALYADSSTTLEGCPVGS